MNHRLRLLFAFPCVFLLGVAGCSKPAAVDPAVVAEYRTQLTLADEPDGAQTVLEVRKAMLGEEAVAAEHVHDHDHEGEAAEHGDEHAKDEPGHDEHAADGHAAEEHAHESAAAVPNGVKAPLVSEMDVVVVGSVGGVANPSEQSHPEFPFSKGKAVFFLADPEAVAEMEEHEHHHAPGEQCAFCAAHAGESAHMLAVVQFPDKQGKTISVDARDLFDLKEKETVVVRGKAKIDPSGMLVVDATGLYIRR